MNEVWLMDVLRWLVVPLMLFFGLVLLLAIPARIASLRREVQSLREELRHSKDTQRETSTAMRTLRDRLTSTRAQLDSLASSFDQLSLNGDSGHGYTQAIRLVERGATLDDLVAACDLSTNEARLILDLHGRQASADTEPGTPR